MPETIRETIKKLQLEVAKGELQAGRASEIMNMLASLIGNVLEEIRDADVSYNAVLLGYLESEKQANRAKIKAECSREFLRKREANDTKILVIEMIRSLKFYLKAKSEEHEVSKFQS